MAKKGKPTAAEKRAKEIERLEKNLVKWAEAYYTAGSSSASDAKYDAAKARLKKLAPDSPILKIVGTKTGGKIKHDPPMLSANKAESVEEVLRWAGKNILVWGFKVDGLSMKVVYRNGQLMLAATRGNGREGENTTAQALMIADIPKQVSLDEPFPDPFFKGDRGGFEARGEVYMTKAAFERANAEEGYKYNSPRNLAVGTLKSNDMQKVVRRNLKFMAWDVIVPGLAMNTTTKIEFLKRRGFKTADQEIIRAGQIPAFWAKMIDEHDDKYPFEMDGIVFKMNSAQVQASMKPADTYPTWMIALKWPPKKHKTVIESITWQVSRTGKLTPVAELAKVRIEGSNIVRATLNNAAFVKERDIAAGDIVYIEKAGGTIPHVASTKKAEDAAEHASIPTRCPNCGSKTYMSGRELYCENPQCGDAAIRNILHFVEAAGIEGIGKAGANLLYHAGAKHPADLYGLSADDLGKILNSKAIGAKVHANIKASRTIPFDKFLQGLNVVALGEHASRKIAMHASSIEAVTPELVRRLYRGKTGEDIVKGLAKKPWVPFVKAGVKFAQGEVKKLEYPVTAESSIAGKKVYVTGTIPGMNKVQVEEFVTQHGGIYGGGTSPNLQLLVTGQGVKADNAKVASALKRKIKTVTWAEFQRLLQGK